MKKVLKKSIIIGVILLILLMCGYCFAKYNGNIAQKITGLIAKPIFILEGGDSVNVDAIKAEGIYAFSIKNYTQEGINQVPLQYSISIDSDLSPFFKYTLYQDEKEIQFNGNTTNKIEMKANEKVTNNYKLKINYIRNETIESGDIIKNIKIKVNSEQTRI